MERQYFWMEDNYASQGLSDSLFQMLRGNNKFTVVCVGTDKVIGDSIGPLVGTMLKERGVLDSIIGVYGDLSTPIHANNIKDVLKVVDTRFPVIAIDSSLGSKVDYISIIDQPLNPGIGVGNTCPSIGSISITGIVLTPHQMDLDDDAPSQVRFLKIYKMASIISSSVQRVSSRLYYSERRYN